MDGDESNTTAEDTTLTVPAATGLLANATDVDGNTPTITQFVVDTNADGTPEVFGAGQTATIVGVGSLRINANGSYSFVPVANYNGPVPVATYTVSDGNGGSDTSTLTLTVTPVNDAPVDGDETVAVNEDTPLSVPAATGLLANATDVDGDTLSITRFTVGGTTYTAGQTATLAGVGQLTINANGSYSFVPAANYNGPVPVATYTVSDGNGGSDTSTLTLTVTPVNDAPVDGDESNTTAEDTTLTVAAGSAGSLLLNATDVDGDTLTITQFVVDTNADGTPEVFAAGQTATIVGVGSLRIDSNGSYSFVPVANYNGAVPVATYTVSDGNGGTDTSTLTLMVTPVNDAPVDGDESNTTAEDTTLTVPAATGLLANATDVDGDTLSITRFTVGGTTFTAGQTATLAGVGQLTINANGSYSFVPAANYNGPVPVATYTVSDGNGGTDTSTLTLTVTPVNDAPVDGDESNTTAEDTTLTVPAATGLLANATDVDGDTLTITQFVVDTNADGAPEVFAAGQTATIVGVGALRIDANGSYSFVPVANYNGAVPVATYTVSDGNGGSDTSTLTLTVSPVNDGPVGSVETVAAAENMPFNVPVGSGLLSNAIDVDDNPLTITQFTVDTNGDGRPEAFTPGQSANIDGVGVLTINANGSYSFLPLANFKRNIPVVTYTVWDGSLADIATLNLIPTRDIQFYKAPYYWAPELLYPDAEPDLIQPIYVEPIVVELVERQSGIVSIASDHLINQPIELTVNRIRNLEGVTFDCNRKSEMPIEAVVSQIQQDWSFQFDRSDTMALRLEALGEVPTTEGCTTVGDLRLDTVVRDGIVSITLSTDRPGSDVVEYEVASANGGSPNWLTKSRHNVFSGSLGGNAEIKIIDVTVKIRDKDAEYYRVQIESHTCKIVRGEVCSLFESSSEIDIQTFSNQLIEFDRGTSDLAALERALGLNL